MLKMLAAALAIFAQNLLLAQLPTAPPATTRGQFCQTQNGLAKAWWQKGHDNFMSGDLTEAVSFFRKSAGADSNFCDPFHGLSVAYTALQKLDSAEIFARRAFVLNPSDKFKMSLATTLGLRGNYAEAVPLLEQLLKSDFQKPVVHQSLAQVFLFQEKFPEAIAQANASLALCEKTDPELAATDYLILGSANLWQNKPELARPFLQKAEALGAKVPESYRKAAGL